jgi:hypothetical protein
LLRKPLKLCSATVESAGVSGAYLLHFIEETLPPGLTFLFELVPKFLGLLLRRVGSLALSAD